MKNLVSVIMAVYNAGEVVERAVQSVIDQSYDHWELLIIDDGSTDDSLKKVKSFRDPRIRSISQDNKGAAAARNVGLSVMTGEFFCFLDADDALPIDSLKLRLEKFHKNERLNFVDGHVLIMDSQLEQVRRSWIPDFNGNPFRDLVALSGRSFFGLTWMVKRIPGRKYRMRDGLTHSEDLLFYLELSREGGQYGWVAAPILLYRNSAGSAMKNLGGLESGYRTVYRVIREWAELGDPDLSNYRQQTKRIMVRSYVRNGMFLRAWKILSRWP